MILLQEEVEKLEVGWDNRGWDERVFKGRKY